MKISGMTDVSDGGMRLNLVLLMSAISIAAAKSEDTWKKTHGDKWDERSL